jgi:hypothetical protein
MFECFGSTKMMSSKEFRQSDQRFHEHRAPARIGLAISAPRFECADEATNQTNRSVPGAAAECASLASTAIMPDMRDEYRELARHYLLLAEAVASMREIPSRFSPQWSVVDDGGCFIRASGGQAVAMSITSMRTSAIPQESSSPTRKRKTLPS